jgi:hypothetical protein
VAPKTEIDRELIQLEVEMKKLEAEYNLYFIGRLPRPPHESRKHVEGLVKKLDRTHIQNTAERFRFTTLQTRFHRFADLWERALRAKEEGRPLPGRMRAGGEPPAEPPRAASAPKKKPAGEEMVHVAAVRDPAAQADKVKELYQQMAAARRAAGEAELPFERFQAVVQHQLSKLGQGGEVAFKVTMKDGKVNLTAKAIKRTGESE